MCLSSSGKVAKLRAGRLSSLLWLHLLCSGIFWACEAVCSNCRVAKPTASGLSSLLPGPLLLRSGTLFACELVCWNGKVAKSDASGLSFLRRWCTLLLRSVALSTCELVCLNSRVAKSIASGLSSCSPELASLGGIFFFPSKASSALFQTALLPGDADSKGEGSV